MRSPQEPGDVQKKSLNSFLKSVELKAYRIAVMAVSEHADALDIVQDSMLRLASKYADRSAAEWKPLFYRILQNRITDYHRQVKLRRLMGFLTRSDEEPAQELSEPEPRYEQQPDRALLVKVQQEDVLAVLRNLPHKQQCFLLRSWEGMSVADTAMVMGCSQGSVKTHYFRAVNKLRVLLGECHDIKI